MLSLSGDPRRKPFDPGLPAGVAWDDRYDKDDGPGSLDSLLRAEGPGTVAAVILEGVVGANGVFVPPPGYYRRIRETCDRHGVLFIADEVLSGFGRTGRWFAVDHDGVAPDMITCAKGLTGGYAPGGAVIVSERIARHFDDNVLSCGLTAYAHPLTCAAIVAAITAYKKEKLMPRAAALGEKLRAQLGAFTKTRPYIAETRGLGLLWALDLREPRSDLPASPARMKLLSQDLRRRHVHIHKRDNLLFLAPPLVATPDELKAGLASVGKALDATWSVESP
jgi:taurine--2-oxoglutarate transaminase